MSPERESYSCLSNTDMNVFPLSTFTWKRATKNQHPKVHHSKQIKVQESPPPKTQQSAALELENIDLRKNAKCIFKIWP